MRKNLIVYTLILLITLTACAGGQTTPTGDPNRGKAVFTSDAKPPCATCHAIQNVSDGQIGPDLTHIGTEAATRVKISNYTGKAKDAAAYIRESVIDPNAFIASPCPTGSCFRDIMPSEFGKTLTEQQLNDLIAFLLSQK